MRLEPVTTLKKMIYRDNSHALCYGDVGIIGASGRMGKRIIAALEKRGNYRSIGGYDQEYWEKGILFSSLDALFQQSTVVLDFSAAALFPDILKAAHHHPKPMVLGTTGIPAVLMKDMYALAQHVPIVVAPNTSFGAVIQRWLAGKLAPFFPDSYDIDIVETHHRHKKDHPSGTAVALAETIVMAKKEEKQNITVGPSTSPREKNRIEMHALRCGQVFGMHEVMWTGDDDRLVVGHTVFSPQIFAEGALSLVQWLVQGQSPGLYSVEDVLGLTHRSL